MAHTSRTRNKTKKTCLRSLWKNQIASAVSIIRWIVSRYRTRGIFITSSNSSSSSSIESRAVGRKKAPLMGHVGARVRVAPLLLVNSSCDREHAHQRSRGRIQLFPRESVESANERDPEVCAIPAEGSTENSTLLSFSLHVGTVPNRAEK